MGNLDGKINGKKNKLLKEIGENSHFEIIFSSLIIAIISGLKRKYANLIEFL